MTFRTTKTKATDMNFERGHDEFKTKRSLPAGSKKGDEETCGQSLINFMTLATGSVKTALQKPANYKKNINHRRYLQKQLKICSRRKKRSTKSKVKTAPKMRKGGSKRALGNVSNELWFEEANCGEIFLTAEAVNRFGDASKNSSIFPAFETSFNGFGRVFSSQNNFTNNSTNFQNGFTWHNSAFSEHEQEQAQLLAMQHSENNCAFVSDDSLPIMIDEETEQFLTGEELTHVLDIKDLFVPERAQENNGFNDIVKYSSCTFDENMYSGFQTVPSATSILSW